MNSNSYGKEIWTKHLHAIHAKFWYNSLSFFFFGLLLSYIAIYALTASQSSQVLIGLSREWSFLRRCPALVFDYNSYLTAASEMVAARIWLVELQFFSVSVFFILILLTIYLFLLFRDRSALIRLGAYPVVASEYAWNIGTLLVLLGLRFSGLYEALVLGNYRVSFGASNFVLVLHGGHWLLIMMSAAGSFQALVHFICRVFANKN
jgi:hypothetical protein